jgi:hypothetical protein
MENPPSAPAVTAQKMLARLGNGPFWVKAIPIIRAKAQTCEKAVRTKVFARRAPYPPAKSEVPHRNTAAIALAAGAKCGREYTPDEGNTRHISPSLRALRSG